MKITIEKDLGGLWTAKSPDLPTLLLIDEKLDQLCEDLPHIVFELRRRVETAARPSPPSEEEVMRALDVLQRRVTAGGGVALAVSHGNMYLVAAAGDGTEPLRRALEPHLLLDGGRRIPAEEAAK